METTTNTQTDNQITDKSQASISAPLAQLEPVLAMMKAALATLSETQLAQVVPEGFGRMDIKAELAKMTEEEINAALPHSMNIQDEPTAIIMEAWVAEHWNDNDHAEAIEDKANCVDQWLDEGDIDADDLDIEASQTMIENWLSNGGQIDDVIDLDDFLQEVDDSSLIAAISEEGDAIDEWVGDYGSDWLLEKCRDEGWLDVTALLSEVEDDVLIAHISCWQTGFQTMLAEWGHNPFLQAFSESENSVKTEIAKGILRQVAEQNLFVSV